MDSIKNNPGTKNNERPIRFVTVSGPPSSGKTSIVLRATDHLKAKGWRSGVVKFDCMRTYDDTIYEKNGIPVKVGL